MEVSLEFPPKENSGAPQEYFHFLIASRHRSYFLFSSSLRPRKQCRLGLKIRSQMEGFLPQVHGYLPAGTCDPLLTRLRQARLGRKLRFSPSFFHLRHPNSKQISRVFCRNPFPQNSFRKTSSISPARGSCEAVAGLIHSFSFRIFFFCLLDYYGNEGGMVLVVEHVLPRMRQEFDSPLTASGKASQPLGLVVEN